MVKIAFLVLVLCSFAQGQTEEEARQWAEEYNAEAQVVWYDAQQATWIYNTNLTDFNQDESVSEDFQRVRVKIFKIIFSCAMPQSKLLLTKNQV